MGEGSGGDREGGDRCKVRDLLADARCSQAVPDFLSISDVRRRIPAPAEEDVQSEATEWELRERRQEAEELGAGG